MYLGRYQQGDTIVARMVATNSSGTATWPTEAGKFRVYNPSGVLVESGSLSLQDSSQTGLLGVYLRLGSSYSTAGRYTIDMICKMSSTLYRRETAIFRLVGGGDSKGVIHSLFCWDRPEATYLVAGADDGKIIQGRNPRV